MRPDERNMHGYHRFNLLATRTPEPVVASA